MKPDSRITRKLIQAAAFGFTNSRLSNFASGSLYTGKWKQFCAPGLNCHSCPAATFACPIGALQAVLADRRFSMSFYVTGLLLAFGVLLGRAVCGFLCPFGLFQELIHKRFRRKAGKSGTDDSPSGGSVTEKDPARRRPLPRLPRFLTYIKYAVLIVFVFYLPLFATVQGIGVTAFCKYLCPAGTLEAGIPEVLAVPQIRNAVGILFSWKVFVLFAVIVLSHFFYRFFCRVLCPLGAVYGILNKVSLYRLRVDPSRCVACGSCAEACRMGVDPVRFPDSAECIRCGECAHACPSGAIRLGFFLRGKTKPEKNTSSSEQTATRA